MRNFLPHEYGSEANNFGVCQNDEGLMFIANNNGVLIYDGRNWERCSRPDQVTIGSIARTADGRIVAGAEDGDIALIEKNRRGKYVYTSLRAAIPRNKWPATFIRQIITLNERTYFLSSDRLIEFSKNGLAVYDPENAFHTRVMVMGGRLYLIDSGAGIRILKDNKLQTIAGTEEFANEKFFFCYPMGSYSYAIGFRNFGIIEATCNPVHPEKATFRKRNAACDSLVISSEVNNGCLLRNRNFIVTSNKAGAFELNRDLQVVRRYDTRSGVYEDNIKAAFQDGNGNLWLAMYYGLAYVEINSNLYHYTRSKGINGPVQSAAYFDHRLFVSTDKGVQYYDSAEQKFRMYNDFNLQTWYLLPFAGQLLAGTSRGLCSFTGNSWFEINHVNTFYLFKDPVHSEVLYAGTENGLDVYYFDGSYNLLKSVPVNAAVKSICADSLNNIFFTTNDQRLFYVNYESDLVLDSVKLQGQLPKEYIENYVFRFNSQVLLGAYDGIYRLVRQNGKNKYRVMRHQVFWPLTDSSNIFRASQFRNAIVCSQLNLDPNVVPVEEKVTMLEKSAGEDSFQISVLNHLNKIRPNFIKYDSTQRVLLVAANEGLFLLDNSISTSGAEHRLVIKYIQYNADTLLDNITASLNPQEISLKLPYSSNDVLVTLGFTGYEISNLEFSYLLEGRDDQYHGWTTNNLIVLSNLREGAYTLKIRARSETPNREYEISVPFRVLAPWYRSWWSYSFYLILFIAFVIFVVQAYNKRLISQNKKLEETIVERTKTISNQKEEIEHKQQEIMDSINYAQRIQRALLATDRMLEQHLKNYFVFFQPKDIVSGDFYWAAELPDQRFVLVTADSTGHGVPGAIMSMLNISCLTDAIEAKGLREPNEILNATRRRVIAYLANDGSKEGGKDGMDCSLIRFDFDSNSISYAAANNPVWIVRKEQGEVKMIELACDKMPVGKHDKDDESFTQYEAEVKSGDMVYALTDGFPDQFGGPKGKKFMYRKLKDTLIGLYDMPVAEQKVLLESVFSEWRGEQEQVDDVTLIGVRIN